MFSKKKVCLSFPKKESLFKFKKKRIWFVFFKKRIHFFYYFLMNQYFLKKESVIKWRSYAFRWHSRHEPAYPHKGDKPASGPNGPLCDPCQGVASCRSANEGTLMRINLKKSLIKKRICLLFFIWIHLKKRIYFICVFQKKSLFKFSKKRKFV